MPNLVRVTVDGVDDLLNAGMYDAGAIIRLQSCATETGTYANETTAALVSGTDIYTLYDADGASTTWYRTRYENAGGTVTSDWSDPFQVGDETTGYANLDDLLDRLDLPDTSEYKLLTDILVNVSAQFDAEANRQFYRIPQGSGTAVRLYDGEGDDVLFVPEGIVSLDLVEVADQTNGSFSTIGTADWRLRPKYPTASWPYTQLHLYGYVFTEGFDTVRLTGVFGFEAVPRLITEAVLELSARTYHESKTRHAGLAGIGDTGLVSMPQYRPDAWHRALRAYGRLLT